MLEFQQVLLRSGKEALLVKGTVQREQQVDDKVFDFAGIVLIDAGMDSCDIAAYFTAAACIATVSDDQGKMFAVYISRDKAWTYGELLFLE